MTGGMAVSLTPAHAATGCGVTYSVDAQWSGGFTGNVTLTNLGDPVSSWTLTWTFASGQQVSQAWNSTVSQSGSQVTARSVSHNGSLATGASASFGFNGTWNGSNPVPASFAMNGTTCTGAPSTGNPTPTPTNPPPSTPPPTNPPPSTPPPSNPPGNPNWGQGLPPAGAQTSQAYDRIRNGTDYTPRSGECSTDIHARYWTYGPDGKVYPTWHPTRDSSGCNFGHEHGDDPRPSDLFSTAGWPAFGYTSEVMASTLPASSQRHEDHVGHKVLTVNNVNVIQGDNGTSFFPPQGTTIAVCDVLLKFHQGTHSKDAFTNNIHELIYNSRCQQSNGGAVTEARFSLMIPIGRAGGFSPSECPGFGGQFINVGPAVPADSPSESRSLGRLITEPGCVQAIREGRTHRDPLYPNPVPFTVSDMDDFWFSDFQVTGSGLNFRLAPLFYVVNPARYYDPAKPDRLGRIVDLCYTDLAGGDYCDQARRVTQQTGQQLAWDDSRSPFKGTLREFRPGFFVVQNSGPSTVYTDAYGRNVSSTPFNGSIQQYFSGNSATQLFVRGATRDWGADHIHAPN
ncbi:cellulose-binding domain-containing protein [Micromonospora sp. WMMD1082]|uniref:cellulose-binding domain-containing protein n=1 Tax=Micromonospora sp. WMMD1082 TaxID=3016104 RepID=UPI002417F92C|nr:cellulose-binding domain-containing protein [Micromonospora sp. WMMD1082]MDG4794952.1 cellulose-binding domain-containing protein [Micromonospora sp. WMMD1082]